MLLTDFPCIVKKYAPHFKDCFSEAGYEHFQRFVSGFMLSDNKTVEAINRLFVLSPRNQSSSNRFLNRQNFDLEQLTQKRLALMQQSPATCFKQVQANGRSGVLSIDNSLLSHYGEKMDNIYRLYNYVDNHFVMAHNLLSLYYSDDQTDYPVFYRLWEPPDWEAVAKCLKAHQVHINEQKWKSRFDKPKIWREYMRYRYRAYQFKVPQVLQVYKSKSHLALELLRKFQKDYPELDFPVALDSGFTSAELCQVIDQELNMAYIGGLQPGHKLLLAGSKEINVEDFTKQLVQQHLEGQQQVFQKTTVKYRGKKETYYTYCKNHRLNKFGKQRLVISFRKSDLSDKARYTICNRLSWYAAGILRIRRHRWPVETYHQESKVEGLDKYQLRNLKAIESHIALVVVAFTMLKRAIHDKKLLSSIQQRLQNESGGTLPFLRRLMKADGLLMLILYIQSQLNQGNSLEQVVQSLVPHIAY